MDRSNWDDLRYVHAVATAGSVRKGAASLKVSHQTVARHIESMESLVGTKLFLRTPDGCLPTPAAEELAAVAADVSDRIGAVVGRVKAERLRPSGVVRVAVLGTLVPFLAGIFGEFCLEYAEIELEIIEGPMPISFTKREADVALRFSTKPPDSLVGRRLGKVATALYASPQYLERIPSRRDLAQHTWVAWERAFDDWPVSAWMRQNVPEARIRARANSTSTFIELVRAGLGVGVVACLAADSDPGLVRVRKRPLDIDLWLWQLTHPDLRRSAPVRAFLDFVHDRVVCERSRIEGRLRS